MAAQTILSLGVGAFLALAGLLLWAVRPERWTERIAGALLILWGAVTAASAATSTAANAQDASLYAHVNIWYTLALPPLLLFLLREMASAPRWRSLDLAIAAGVSALNLAGALAFALRPTLFIEGVLQFAGLWGPTSGPLLYALGAEFALVEAYVVIRAASVVTPRSATAAHETNAALLGYAIALPLLHNAAFFTTFSLSINDPPSQARAFVSIAAALVAIPAIARILRSLPRSRAVLAGGAALVVLVGLVDGVAIAGRLQQATYGGYTTSLVLVRLAFAIALSLTMLRYGLADVGAAGRTHAQAALRAGAIAMFAALALGIAFALMGGSLAGNAIALGVAIVVPVAARKPLADTAARVLLPPDDPRAIAERARTYASALAAARGPDGAILPEGEALLAQMRADLGISAQEHALLLSGVASREEDRYHKLQTLGRGATAQVELAVDEIAGRRVVVKRFQGLRDPGAVLTEARALAAVRHPRVIPFLEVDRRGDEVHLVLAYAEGGSARQLLDRNGPLDPRRAVALTRDLLEGLDALHRAGLVHCDVKPENLLIGADGRGLLGDFGSAHFAAPDLVDATLTGAGAEGSLSTIAPEALRGAPPAPTRDVYAAGALLYRLLTGDHYVDLANATVFEARERITMDPPRLPDPRVPPALEPMIRKALAKRPADRYQSAREMLTDLLR